VPFSYGHYFFNIFISNFFSYNFRTNHFNEPTPLLTYKSFAENRGTNIKYAKLLLEGMALSFQHTLPQALENIQFFGEQTIIPIHPHQKERTEETITHYGQAKWAIVDKLNERYSSVLNTEFNLHHWLHYNEYDEVAYFLNEAGSNTLIHSQFKAPSHFHLWLGKKGFVIGIEQRGKGFNAEKINTEKKKKNEGAAFEFYRKCKGRVFFDDSVNARRVYLEVMV